MESIAFSGDTDGSVEALLDILETYDRQDDCRLDVLHYGVGPVTVTDLELAQAFNGIVYAMHVGIHQEAKLAAKKSEVKQFKVAPQSSFEEGLRGRSWIYARSSAS